MKKTYIINGGAGRVVAAIPALQDNLKHNSEAIILAQGWAEVFKNHPILQNRVYSYSDRGIFELYIKDSEIIYPEPYYSHLYYRQHRHMVDVFYDLINKSLRNSVVADIGTKEPWLYTSSLEDAQMKSFLSQFKNKSFVVFQPYGSGMKILNDRPYDPSFRSFDVDDALKIIKIMSEKHTVFYMGPDEYRHPGDTYSVDLSKVTNRDLRFYITLIKHAKYFIGCDSAGNHIANALQKPNAIVLGSTIPSNVVYPNSVTHVKDIVRHYIPIRISDETVAEYHSQAMSFSEEEIINIATSPDFFD